MTAEQILRCAAFKKYRNLKHEDLAFHLQDSNIFRAFAELYMGHDPSASTLQKNIKALSAETWEAVYRMIIGRAENDEIEKGRTLCIYSTAVEINIHYPMDSQLLQDGIRIINRLLLTEGFPHGTILRESSKKESGTSPLPKEKAFIC